MMTLLQREMGILQSNTYSQESLAGSPFQLETAVPPTCFSQSDDTCQGFLAGVYQDKDWIVSDSSVFALFLNLILKIFHVT